MQMRATLHAAILVVTLLVFSHGDAKERTKRQTGGPYDNVDYWNVADLELQKALSDEYKNTRAKNIIMFMGDGMGVSTTTAARIYHEQSRGLTGTDVKLAWDKFPHTALSRTYTLDNFTPDSSGTSTAYQCGDKTISGTLCVRHTEEDLTCPIPDDVKLKSVLKYAQDKNKWTGVVTNIRVTYVAPAGAYASVPNREWEADSDMPEEKRDSCHDIARHLVDDEYGKNIRVILGGGRQNFYPETMADPEWPNLNGKRLDGRKLTEEWVNDKIDQGFSANEVKYVTGREDFDNVNTGSVEYLMGLFEYNRMQYETDREKEGVDNFGEPSLTEMVEKAINVLSRNEDGFFLLVVGGMIDQGHHNGFAMRALNETVSMSDAVTKATQMTDASETLTIVHADHSHTFTISGYQSTSTDILGLADNDAGDDKPYLSLGYNNGPGELYHRRDDQTETGNVVPRLDLTDNEGIGQPDFRYDAGIYRSSETHAGEDVAVYAQGPMSHLFHGVHEQNYIAHVMMYAACLEPYEDTCPVSLASTPIGNLNMLVMLVVFCKTFF